MAAERPIRIPADGLLLEGLLGVPPDAVGIVLFAHGSGSSRLSPRNAFVARELRRAKMVTLLFDLLSVEESDEPALVFDVELLARRLRAATEWVRGEPATRGLAVAYFGASTGAAAALIAAAADPAIAAVVSRGGRPDLAARVLPRVEAPTLLIVGGDDAPVSRAFPDEGREAAMPILTKLKEFLDAKVVMLRDAHGYLMAVAPRGAPLRAGAGAA